ncbi:MAG: hypothetical protein ACXVB9_10955 [Bdellovibrionota bacterium]
MEDTEKSGRNLRSIRGFLVRPKQQLRGTLVFVGMCIFFQLLMLIGFRSALDTVITQFAQSNPDLAVQMSAATVSVFRLMVAYVFFLAVVTLVIGIVITHRTYGPLVPILRHVNDLTQRKFNARVHLRTTDELQELASALNLLAETLEKDRA